MTQAHVPVCSGPGLHPVALGVWRCRGAEVEVEHAAHLRRRGPGARGGGGAKAGLELAGLAASGPAAVADGLRAA
jgi:hypothetical protein